MAFKHRRLTAKALEGADRVELSKTGTSIVVIRKAAKANVDPKTKVLKGHIFAQEHQYYPVNEGNLKRVKLWKPSR